MADPLETRYYATCVITPNLVVSAYVEGVPKRLGMLAHRPLWTGAWPTRYIETRSCATYADVPNLVALNQIVLA